MDKLKRNGRINNSYDGKKIVLYRAGSRGEVVGVYDSIKDIANMEKMFNKKFAEGSIYQCLSGKVKHFVSFNHQCKVRPIAMDVNQKLNNNV